MSVKSNIPNYITLLNLFSGCIAVVFAVVNRIEYAAFFVFLGIFFDFFDGFFARILKVQSELGKQLDSLADMVTSGMVPGVVMVQMLLKSGGFDPLVDVFYSGNFLVYPMLGFLITLASCYRLGKFNIDTRQSESFIGLPTPANTLFIISLPLLHMYHSYYFMSYIVDNVYVLLLITVLSCYMLNAEIHLFSLKFKSYKLSENKVKYLYLFLAVLLLIFLQLAAVPLLILLYMLLSMLNRKVYS